MGRARWQAAMERQGHCLTRDGHHPACPEPEGWRVYACRLDQAGADILAPVGLLDGSVCAIDLGTLQRLTSEGKQSRTQIPPLHTWANPARVTAAGVGFISQEDLCPEEKGGRAEGGCPAHLRARGCLPRLRTRMCAPICCTAHSHVLPWHMHL